jgi:type 2 lantibiotic biosynthesis protein LanM
MIHSFSNADYLHERLSRPDNSPALDGADADFFAWKEVLAASGETVFSKRLASLNQDETQARQSTRRAKESGEATTPRWFALLQEAFDSCDAIPIEIEQPFANLWVSIAAYARKKVDFRALVSLDVLSTFVNSLHSEICQIAAEATYAIFCDYRARGFSYDHFVDSQRRSQCADIFSKYPALARLIGTLVLSWIQTTQTFFERLENDRALLFSAFAVPLEIDLTSVTVGLSDRHAGGFQAILAKFGSTKVLYKPKDMSLEALLPTINQWLEAENFPTLFRFPRSIDRGEYGWAEWISQQPCDSIEEVRHYYKKAGALLCLAQVLNAKDLLFENVIACASEPVLIDLEAFLQPEVRTFDQIGKAFSGDHPAYQWRGSVIDVAFLPFWQFSSSHPTCDLSGLGCRNDDLPPISMNGWDQLNSDGMRPVLYSSRAYRARNEVLWNGNVQKASDFSREIELGFAELHNFILKNRESFLAFVQTFAQSKSRLVFRSTQLYGRLLKQSLSPTNLESGIRRSIVFEQLYRPPLKGGYLSNQLQQVLDFEAGVLLNLDVPRFYIPANSDTLTIDSKNRVAKFLWEPPLKTVERRIHHMSEAALQHHQEVIRQSLDRKPKIFTSPIAQIELRRIVQEYVDMMLSRVEPKAKSTIWALPTFVEVVPPLIEQIGLYSGDLGILIFLAAADRLLHQSSANPLLERFRTKLEQFPVGSGPLGIGNGVGSLIYGSLLLGTILEDQSWFDLAERLFCQLTEERVRSENDPDLLYGIAGLLLAIGQLHKVRPDDRKERLASVCLVKLFEGFHPREGWKRPNGDSPLGFAHGAAGISYAAAVAGKIFENNRAQTLAQNGIDFDRRHFNEAEHNWPSTTNDNHPASMRAWCSGLTGMFMSRVGIWRIWRDSELQAEVDANLPFLPELLGLDHWCCGSAGVAEAFVHAAQVFDRKDLLEKARTTLDQTVRRALKTTYYRFSPHVGQNYCFQPSLFRGLAGLGYTLIRTLEPRSLPCIMAFEL